MEIEEEVEEEAVWREWRTGGVGLEERRAVEALENMT